MAISSGRATLGERLPKLVNIDDGVLECDVVGDGEPVVFIHGSVIADGFAPLLREPQLSERDRPGLRDARPAPAASHGLTHRCSTPRRIRPGGSGRRHILRSGVASADGVAL
jgi:hypothetical protein